MMAVCETQVCEDADPLDFHKAGYTFLSAFFPHRGLAIYIRNDIVYQWQQHLFTSDAEFTALWVKLKVQAHLAHFSFVEARVQPLTRLIGFLILESYPDSEIITAGDFNIHNTKWFHHSSHTS